MCAALENASGQANAGPSQSRKVVSTDGSAGPPVRWLHLLGKVIPSRIGRGRALPDEVTHNVNLKQDKGHNTDTPLDYRKVHP